LQQEKGEGSGENGEVQARPINNCRQVEPIGRSYAPRRIDG